MIAGIVLIVLGVGLFATARVNYEVTDETSRGIARRTRRDRPGPFNSLYAFLLERGALMNTAFGLIVGAGALVVGFVMVVSAVT